MLVTWKLRARPEAADLVGPQAVDALAVEQDLAAGRAEAAADQVEQRRLAGAVGPDDGDALARRHGQVGAADDLGLAEGLAQVLQLDGEVRRAGGAHAASAPRPAACDRRRLMRPRCARSRSRCHLAPRRAKRRRASSNSAHADDQRRRPRRASSPATARSSVRPRKCSSGPSAIVELQVVDHLDQRRRAGQHQQRGRRPAPGTAAPAGASLPKRGHAHVHHDQAGDAAGRVHHHEQEDQPEVEQPGLGELGQQHEGQHHQDRADDRAEEERRAAEEGEQQVGARARRADDLGGDDLEVERVQAAGDAGEEAGDDERRCSARAACCSR